MMFTCILILYSPSHKSLLEFKKMYMRHSSSSVKVLKEVGTVVVVSVYNCCRFYFYAI